VRPAQGVAVPDHSPARQRHSVPAADRQPLFQSGQGDQARRGVLPRGSARGHFRHRRHVASAPGQAGRADQQGVGQAFSGQPVRRCRGCAPHSIHRVRARGRLRGHRDGHVAHLAWRPGEGRARGVPLLSRTGVQHGARPSDSREQELQVMSIKLVVAGQGAFGIKHLEALQKIPDVEVVSLAGGNLDTTREVAQRFKIPHFSQDLAECLARPGVQAAILATPTQLHAKQRIQCLRAGKHVQIEIPVSDTLEDAEALAKVQKETGLIAMGGHTRRFNPSHQWIHKRIAAGELKVLQMDVQTYFFRRTNMNALGKPRSWTDHLLWHHACHTVDLFAYQAGESVSVAFALQGPMHPELKIAMDMGILLKTRSGAVCTLSLSFNNDGPLGTFFRYICDNGTYIARYDELVDGNNNDIDVSKVDVSMNGIELQDREFIAAIREKREPNSSVQQVLPAMRTLGKLEDFMNSAG